MSFKSLLIAVSLFASQLALAHGGGLNSEGCHKEKETGDYHCHRSTSSANAPQKNLITSTFKRKDFNYRSYKSSTSVGFYTGKVCSPMNIDHLVSLKDAHESGASEWSSTMKAKFANDRDNHAPSCHRINSSKGSAGPEEFLRRSRDGKGLDYKIIGFCNYVSKYHSIKIKYGLSFSSNSKRVFEACGISI